MKLLLIEDSPRLSRSLRRGLTQAGHVVDAAVDGLEGLAFAEGYDYDVVILDLLLPGLPGLEVLRHLRAAGRDVHVLILSARDRVEDRIQGLQLGADDYLIKPFAFGELEARLEALGRRRHGTKRPVLSIGPLELDTTRREVRRDDQPIHLTPSEYGLLEALCRRRGRPLSQARLVELLRPGDADVSENAIEVLISALRKKIHRPGDPPIVRTRRGFGYVVE